MEIAEKPITIQGQMLKSPTIFYGKKQAAASGFSFMLLNLARFCHRM
jgi:hypothetical protein